MSKPVQLKLKQTAFEQMHRDLDKSRRSSEFIKVNRQALTDLLMDYGDLLGRVEYVNAPEDAAQS